MFVVWGAGFKTGRLEKVAPVREEGTTVLLYLPSHWRVQILDLVVDHLLGLIATPTNPGEHHLLLISVACVPRWMCEVVILKETGQRNRSVVQSRHGSVCAFTKGNQGIVYLSVVCSAREHVFVPEKGKQSSRLDICAPAQLLIFVCCLSRVEAQSAPETCCL